MRQKMRMWLQNSLILSWLDRAAAAIYRMLREGFFGRLFTAYFREDELFGESVIGSHIRPDHMRRRDSLFSRVQLAVARNFENSFFTGLFSRLANYLLSCSLRMYGLFFSSFAVYTLLIFLIQRYALSLQAENGTFLMGTVILLAALPLLASRQPLAEALLNSAFLRPLLLNVAGVPRELLENRRLSRGRRNHIAFLAGVALGLLTYFIPAVLLLLILAGAVAVMLVLSMPEIGILTMIALLPYLVVFSHPSIALAALILLTAFSYFLKLLRGKRVLRIELLDFAVIFFGIAFLSGGLVSFSGAGSLKTTAIYICFLLGYFLVVNLMRTRIWLRRCTTTLLVSGFGTALYGLYENYFGRTEAKWHDTTMFEDIEGRVVSMFENPNMFANYLIMLFPIAFAAFISSKQRHIRYGAGIVSLTIGLCLIYTWSRGAWLGLMIGMLFFLLMWNRRTLSVLLLGVFALPFVPFVLPESIINRFASIGNLADSSTSYRVSIWRAALRIARDFFASGIGVGENAFRQVYPMYSLAGIEAAPHSHNLFLQIQIELGIVGLLLFLCVLVLFVQACMTHNSTAADRETRMMVIGGFAGVLSALAQGMTDYIWYNYRVYFVFWFVLALTSAYIRVGRSERSRDHANLAAYADATKATLELPLKLT
ncbi:MAG: O-antigen ligase family protein [Clostridia bacterium]|nr:O-antigen ligase family protein [Clostridia bacterium]